MSFFFIKKLIQFKISCLMHLIQKFDGVMLKLYTSMKNIIIVAPVNSSAQLIDVTTCSLQWDSIWHFF